MPPHTVRLVPLGGLGEIGMNCLAIQEDAGIVIVDCGAAFPSDDLGVDIVHPDFTWLRQRTEQLCGVFLTHGHEDHVGALPYLLSEIPMPVWGPPHALGVAERRLDEHGFSPKQIDLRVTEPGQTYSVGPFCIEPVRVAHSIVEATALSISTAAGIILHTGDFNFDADPPDGEPTDERRLQEIGDAGVALLLSDSTNSDVPERSGSERSVGNALETLVQDAKARVVIALFASNIQRLILLGEIARQAGRKICLLGRSLETQVAVASRIGRLHWRSDLLMAPEDLAAAPPERVMVLAGGTQAERHSAMRRLALGNHPLLKLAEGDTVVFSSRIIPGNERGVIEMVNDLLRAGIQVQTRVTHPEVHTSGHAGRSEQQRMIELIRPRCFVPLHGTLHHLLRHAELARSLGIAKTQVVENGTPLVCDGTDLWTEQRVPAGKIRVASGGAVLSPETHRQRADLGRSGIVLVCLVTEGQKLCVPPQVVARGVPAVDENEAALQAIARDVARAFEGFRAGRGLPLVETIKRAARRRIEDLSGTRPTLEVQLLKVP